MSGAVGRVCGEARHGQWLAAQCAARPGLVAEVEQAIRDPYGRRDVWPLCSWEDWHRGMRLLERTLRRGTDTFTGDDYAEASRLLSAQGQPFARPLGILGSYAEQVAPYRGSWARRYASRPRTAAEMEAAQLIAEGRVRAPDGASWAGVDGCRYALAMHGGRAVVIVENSADAVELVHVKGALAWIHNRARGTAGPLRTSQTGAACRTSLEDEVLAWLIRAAHDGQPWDLLGQVAWTSHLRAELYRAAESVGKRTAPADPADLIAWRVRASFTYWLPFAPGWAVADAIGWPDARHAHAYYQRLAVTPARQAPALRAAEGLARADAEAAERAGLAAPSTPAQVAEEPARRLVPTGRRRATEPGTRHGQRAAGPRWVQPPKWQPRQAGPEPRR